MFCRTIIVGVVALSSLVSGQILNGNFETADPNSPAYFIAPFHWRRIPIPATLTDCYAGLIYRSSEPNVPSFVPQTGIPYVTVDWTISEPYEGNSFVLLSTGDLDFLYDDREIGGSSISQDILLSGGDTLIGAYFFGTCDYCNRPPNYNDYGEIYLKPSDPVNYPQLPEKIQLVDPEVLAAKCSVLGVGNFGSSGWMTFEYTVEPNVAGPYTLFCSVQDGGSDRIYKSYFAIDNLRICHSDLGRSLADLNYDCDVNLKDFSILSHVWLADCNEVSPFYDPNIPCQGADIDHNGYVDPNDLIRMSQDWLY